MEGEETDWEKERGSGDGSRRERGTKINNNKTKREKRKVKKLVQKRRDLQ